jgi:hypothetical protein
MILLNSRSAARRAAGGSRLLLLLALAVALVFAHGCHRGDIDHELLAPDFVRSVTR